MNAEAYFERALGRPPGLPDHSGLMLAVRITLAQVSPAMTPKSADEPGSAVAPRSVIRALILGAFISLLSLSTISVGVPLGAQKPPQKLAS
jgi:hypothetical protein